MKLKRTLGALLMAFVVTLTVICPVSVVNAGQSNAAYAAEVLRLVNEKRAAAGIPALISSDILNEVAKQRAEYYALDENNYSTCPDGRNLDVLLTDRNIEYQYYWHNLCYGWSTPQQAVNFWLTDSNCKDTILNSRYTYTGICVLNSNGTLYWVQYFVQSAKSPDSGAATQPPTEAPTQPPTEAPTQPPTEAPTEPPTEAPTQPPTEAPTQPPTEAPTEPPTEAPTEPPTEAPTQPPTEAPTEPPTEAPTQPPTEAPTEAPTQPPTDPGTYMLGDVNQDQAIDSSDAALILLAAAQKGAGGNYSLNDVQCLAADVNSDGEINATDASFILLYSAMHGAGSTWATLEGVVKGWYS